MSFEALKTTRKVMGVKQTTKAVEKEMANMVYVAQDADTRVTKPLNELCERKGVTVKIAPSMAELGRACGIEVGASAVAILK